MKDFCPSTLMLLTEITSQQKLTFKADKIGSGYEAEPEDTLLVSVDTGELYSVSKYASTLKVSAYDPVNPRERTSGCDKCGRKILSLQRLGDEKRVVYSCLCGNSFST